jgi:hypothetical protein
MTPAMIAAIVGPRAARAQTKGAAAAGAVALTVLFAVLLAVPVFLTTSGGRFSAMAAAVLLGVPFGLGLGVGTLPIVTALHDMEVHERSHESFDFVLGRGSAHVAASALIALVFSRVLETRWFTEVTTPIFIALVLLGAAGWMIALRRRLARLRLWDRLVEEELPGFAIVEGSPDEPIEQPAMFMPALVPVGDKIVVAIPDGAYRDNALPAPLARGPDGLLADEKSLMMQESGAAMVIAMIAVLAALPAQALLLFSCK